MSVSRKRVVIFGCGYLGQRVAVEALRRDMEVTTLTRNPRQAEVLRAMGVSKVFVGELHDSSWHASVDRRQDLVLNCVSSAGEGWEGYRKSYLQGTESVLQWLAGGGAAETLVFTSSTGVYAQNEGQWVSEDDPAEGADEGGRVLRDAERLLEAKPAGAGRCFSLRLGGIYGPGRHHLLTRAIRRERGEEEGDEIFLNPIQVHDACRAVWAAFEAPASVEGGVFNIVDDRPTPRGEIVRWLMDEADRRQLPILAKETVAAGRARGRGIRPHRRISNRKAKEILGWTPEFADYQAGYLELLRGML